VVGQRLSVYDGRKYNTLLLNDKMVGRKFGELILTRHSGLFIHVKKKVQKKSAKK
jgi:ribosomal protein S19